MQANLLRKRWQVARLLPYFIEISADMLKYVPFAEKAGMMFVGETEGNLKRVHKDMDYLIRNVKRVKGGEIVWNNLVESLISRSREWTRAICPHGKGRTKPPMNWSGGCGIFPESLFLGNLLYFTES